MEIANFYVIETRKCLKVLTQILIQEHILLKGAGYYQMITNGCNYSSILKEWSFSSIICFIKGNLSQVSNIFEFILSILKL